MFRLTFISRILWNIDNIFSYIAIPLGYAEGTYVGLVLVEKMAQGSVLLRVITGAEGSRFMDFLKLCYLNLAKISAEGKPGKVNILFFAIRRERLPMIMDTIKDFNPKSFFTVKSVKNAGDYHIGERSRKFSFLRILNTTMR